MHRRDLFSVKGLVKRQNSNIKDQIVINQVKWGQPITKNIDRAIWSALHNKNLAKINECKSSKWTIDLLTKFYLILCFGELVKPYVRFETNKLAKINRQ